jgi:hypothetical protein
MFLIFRTPNRCICVLGEKNTKTTAVGFLPDDLVNCCKVVDNSKYFGSYLRIPGWLFTNCSFSMKLVVIDHYLSKKNAACFSPEARNV